MTAPDATAGDGLREAIAQQEAEAYGSDWSTLSESRRECWRDDADVILALPALRDVLAAAARDAEKVRR